MHVKSVKTYKEFDFQFISSWCQLHCKQIAFPKEELYNKTNFKMISTSVLSCKQVLLVVVLCSLYVGAYGAQAHSDLQGQVKPTPFPVCIDDSDCLKMGEGNKYACFQVR